MTPPEAGWKRKREREGKTLLRKRQKNQATIKGSSDDDKPRFLPIPNDKKRKAEEVEELPNKRREVTGAPFRAQAPAKEDSKVPDRAADPETSKTGGSKAIGPELPGISAHIAATIAGPKNGHVTDQKTGNSSKSKASAKELSATRTATASKSTASAEELSAAPTATASKSTASAKELSATRTATASKSTASAEELSAAPTATASKSTASAEELSAAPTATASKSTASAKELSATRTATASKSTASAEELSATPRKDHVTDPRTRKSRASKAAGPELPGTIKGDVTDADKSKAAGLELCGTSKKRSAMKAGLEEKPGVKKTRRVPVGLLNHRLACFANSVTRCLQGTAPINSYYRRQASGVLSSVTNCGVTERDLGSMGGGNTRAVCAKKESVRKAFRESTKKISLSAYFGSLCQRMSTAAEPSISPFVFQQAFGTVFMNDSGEPMDGERSEDSYQFLTHLLAELRQEELISQKPGDEAPTVVDNVFGVKTATKFACEACRHEHSITSDEVCIQALIPRQEQPLTLEECFSAFEDRDRPEGYKCGECGKADSTEKSAGIAEIQDHLIFNIKRVTYEGKNTTKISIPQGPIDLSAWSMASASQESNFEVYGVVRHHGADFLDGHYTAMLKIDAQWWLLNDHVVSNVDDAEFGQPQTACQIFLRKVSS